MFWRIDDDRPRHFGPTVVDFLLFEFRIERIAGLLQHRVDVGIGIGVLLILLDRLTAAIALRRRDVLMLRRRAAARLVAE